MDRWSPPSIDSDLAASAHSHSPAKVARSTGHATSLVLPTVNEVDSIRGKAYQDAYARGLQEGLLEGQAQGAAVGREEGIEKGRTEGFQTGYQQGYQSGSNDIELLSKELRRTVQSLAQLPQVVQAALPEWVYETALRLAGKELMDRTVFVAAVQEALMRLPRLGESLIVGVPQQELKAWEDMLQHPEMPFTVAVRADPELTAGYAYVQVEGTRLDVGSHARDALVRSALGLLPQQAAAKP